MRFIIGRKDKCVNVDAKFCMERIGHNVLDPFSMGGVGVLGRVLMLKVGRLLRT